MGIGVDELLRFMPWILTITCANVVHYRSLWAARDAERKRIRKPSDHDAPGPHPPHELLTFDLMQSPIMRKARYKIKLLRYIATSLYILLFHRFIPELHEPYSVNSITLECFIVGALSGLITVYLNENQDEAMRTLWRPGHDFESGLVGDTWDMLRLVGSSLAVPVEEELFYHSWMFRYIVMVRKGEYESFVDVPFWEWNWVAWVVSNGVKGIYNGKEWQSYFISGLLFQWMIGRRGLFLDGLITHSVSNLTVGCWVLATNQRQYW